mgnify:CR=1 FL=1
MAADAALAVLTVHHWTDRARGLAEMARVARRRVVVHWEPADATLHWIVDDYFPVLDRIAAGGVADGGDDGTPATSVTIQAVRVR